MEIIRQLSALSYRSNTTPVLPSVQGRLEGPRHHILTESSCCGFSCLSRLRQPRKWKLSRVLFPWVALSGTICFRRAVSPKGNNSSLSVKETEFNRWWVDRISKKHQPQYNDTAKTIILPETWTKIAECNWLIQTGNERVKSIELQQQSVWYWPWTKSVWTAHSNIYF